MTYKNTLFIALLTSALIAFSPISYAEKSYGEKVGHKTARGFSNFALGFLEVPKSIIKTSNDTNAIYGFTGGLLLGMINSMGRSGVGALELISFPLATKPIVQPVHPWQEYLSLPTSYHNIFDLDK